MVILQDQIIALRASFYCSPQIARLEYRLKHKRLIGITLFDEERFQLPVVFIEFFILFFLIALVVGSDCYSIVLTGILLI
jgi:hypothetical protein